MSEDNTIWQAAGETMRQLCIESSTKPESRFHHSKMGGMEWWWEAFKESCARHRLVPQDAANKLADDRAWINLESVKQKLAQTQEYARSLEGDVRAMRQAAAVPSAPKTGRKAK